MPQLRVTNIERSPAYCTRPFDDLRVGDLFTLTGKPNQLYMKSTANNGIRLWGGLTTYVASHDSVTLCCGDLKWTRQPASAEGEFA